MTSTAPIQAGLLAQAEQRMERRWRDIAIAEERGMPPHVLERMLAAYLQALEAYLSLRQAVDAARGGDDGAGS